MTEVMYNSVRKKSQQPPFLKTTESPEAFLYVFSSRRSG